MIASCFALSDLHCKFFKMRHISNPSRGLAADCDQVLFSKEALRICNQRATWKEHTRRRRKSSITSREPAVSAAATSC
jgi:hypothetical protein